MTAICPEPTVVCDARALTSFARSVLHAIGLRDSDARYMAEQIVASDLAGHESHGVRRLSEYVRRAKEGYADPTASAVIELDHGSLVRINGHRGFGHLIMRDATEIAIQRSRSHGIAAVAVHNSEYAGRFADFCEHAASAGIATILFANDSGAGQDVAPPGGLEGRLSTNPIAAGIPRAASPHLVLDMATSTVAMGRVAEWRDRREEIPSDWITRQGTLQPFGGVKGFGLALVAEALGGALTTAGTVSAAPAAERQGVLLIAIDVSRLRALDEFIAQVESFVHHVIDTPVSPGAAPIRMPGEGSAETARIRRAEGIPVQPFTWRELTRLAADFGLAQPVTAARPGEVTRPANQTS